MPAEELAARLVRYVKVVAGEVPLRGPLYNPVSNLSRANPYFSVVDPADPLTDPRVLARIKAQVQAHRATPPIVSTREQAASVLRVLRSELVQNGSVVGWSEVQHHLPDLRREVSYLRSLAGETGRSLCSGSFSVVTSRRWNFMRRIGRSRFSGQSKGRVAHDPAARWEPRRPLARCRASAPPGVLCGGEPHLARGTAGSAPRAASPRGTRQRARRVPAARRAGRRVGRSPRRAAHDLRGPRNPCTHESRTAVT